MLKKLLFIIPLLALTVLLVWWFTPHYTEEDEAYYRAVFCVIDHDDSRQFLHDMQNIVEGGNSDYALHKGIPHKKICCRGILIDQEAACFSFHSFQDTSGLRGTSTGILCRKTMRVFSIRKIMDKQGQIQM